MRAVCADFETDLVEFTGEHNHVHLLVNFPPTVAVSKLVNSLKGVSSRRMPPGVPRPGTPLLPGQQALLRLVPRRLPRRGTAQRPAPVHRAAEPPGSRHCSGLTALPARIFTPALKGGALARIPVAQ